MGKDISMARDKKTGDDMAARTTLGCYQDERQEYQC